MDGIERPNGKNAAEAHRLANVRLAKSQLREHEARRALVDLHKVQQAEADKTTRLRALRLAKEATDRRTALTEITQKAQVKKAAAPRGAVRAAKA